MQKKILLTLLCSSIGLLFLFSGYTKGGFPFFPSITSPIEPFEFTFVDLHVANWQTAPFIARLMISLEFFIGLLLLFNIKLKKFTYKAGAFVLIIFCIYLILLMLFSGNKGNCGCFGQVLVMTPFQALIKNLALLVLLWILNKYHEGWDNRFATALSRIVLLFAIALPFIWNPVQLSYSESYLNRPDENFKIEMDTLYAHATLTVPPKTLSTGKHVIAFMSLTCPHCRIAAKKMRIMHERNPEIPFYFVLNGKEEKLQTFFDDTHTENIPHCMLKGRAFVYLAGTSMPAIYLVNNSLVEHDLNYVDLDQTEVENWLKK